MRKRGGWRRMWRDWNLFWMHENGRLWCNCRICESYKAWGFPTTSLTLHRPHEKLLGMSSSLTNCTKTPIISASFVFVFFPSLFVRFLFVYLWPLLFAPSLNFGLPRNDIDTMLTAQYRSSWTGTKSKGPLS